jgi:TetR/AcrR family transcriptional regulator
MTTESTKALSRSTKKELVTAFRTREILTAARRVIEEHGLDAFTMEEIASAAGVAKGTIYLYFQGKEDLIQALISQVGENLIMELEAIMARPDSPREKLQRVVAMLLDYLKRERVLFPVYARGSLGGDRPFRAGRWRYIQELEAKSEALLTGLFSEGIETGQFVHANPRLLSFLLKGLVRAVGYYQMAEGQEDVVPETLPVLCNLLSSGVLRRADSPAKRSET